MCGVGVDRIGMIGLLVLGVLVRWGEVGVLCVWLIIWDVRSRCDGDIDTRPLS